MAKAKPTAAAPATKGKKKTECPISRIQFAEKAKAITITLDGQTFTAQPRPFSTGSFGWNLTAKVTVMVDGVPCTVQVCGNVMVVGSKELPQDGEEAEKKAA